MESATPEYWAKHRMVLEWEILLECMALLDKGGPTDADRAWLQSEGITSTVGVDAAEWMYGRQPGEVISSSLTKIFGRAIAILSFSPGGVRVFGRRYNCSGGQCDYYDDPAPGKPREMVTFPLDVDDRYLYSVERGVTGKLGLFLTEANHD